MCKPQLRFNGYSLEWKTVKLDTIIHEKKVRTGDMEKYPLWSLTVESGITPKTDRYERSFLVKKEDNFKVVNDNDYVYNPMNAHIGAIARNKSGIDISVSGYYDVFNIDTKYYGFFDNYLISPVMIKKFKLISTGSLVEKQRVHYSQFKELYINIPDEEEMQDISNLLILLDSRIQMQNEKIISLKKYKKSINNIVFSLPGKVEKISKFIEEYTNKTTENNQYPILSSTLNGIFVQNEYFNKQAASKDNVGYKIVPKDYVTYRSMSDTGEFRFNSQNLVEKGIVSPAYPVFKIKDELINKKYLLNYINESSNFKSQILATKEGGTRFALSFSKFKNLEINIIDEAEYYGNLFDLLNNKIKIEEEILNKLQLLKKGLLQKMFI